MTRSTTHRSGTTRSARRRRPTALLALMLGTVLLLAFAPGAANATGTTDPTAATATPPGKAWVRVGHFVPGMGATSIDLQPLDGSGTPVTLAGDATYGEVTSYDKIAPGSYTATVRDSTTPAGSAPLLSRSFEVGASDARTVAVLGTAEAPRLALLSDDLTAPSAGTARVRVLSASDAVDAVTVTAVGGPTIAEDAVLGQATAYATVPSGTWTLQLQADMAGATLQSVPIASGSVYTVVVLDAGEQAVRLDVVTDAAGAVVAPQGGAHTGGGGTAATSDVASPAIAGARGQAAAGLALALLLALVATSMVRRGYPIRPSASRAGH